MIRVAINPAALSSEARKILELDVSEGTDGNAAESVGRLEDQATNSEPAASRRAAGWVFEKRFLLEVS